MQEHHQGLPVRHLKEEGAEDFVVDKDPGLEHWIDGAGYLILSAMNQVRPEEHWVLNRAVQADLIEADIHHPSRGTGDKHGPRSAAGL